MDLQYWPGETVVGHHTFGGARLRLVQADPLSRTAARLEFEFARSFHHAAIVRTSPPSQIFRSPIDPEPHVPTKPYELIESSNRFLRNQHPEINVPNALLLEHLLEDQDLYESTSPRQSALLTGLSVDESHAVILSVGGASGTELHCSLLASHQSHARRLYHSPHPAAILRTPVQQLANGPSLNLTGQAVFLARTHDSTSFFTYCPPHPSDFSHADLMQGPASSCPSFGFETSYQLTTSDTNHEIHVDSCVGHTISDHLHQFIVLNSKGQLWKVAGIGGNRGSVKQVGQIDRVGSGQIDWARCGIYPTNDCLVVGLRKSLDTVDHRLAGTCSQLYAPSNGCQITDIQRYNNNRSPHLRLINTTSSLVWIDDRKPHVPILSVKHFRAPDRTLNMSFSAEPEWSPHSSFSLSTAGERFDRVLIWSRMNDVASLREFKSYPAIPPGVLGHAVNVPLVSCNPSNYRTGLLFFRHKAFNGDHQKISLVEMKRDGSIWYQQLKLSGSTGDAPPSSSLLGPHAHQNSPRPMIPADDSSGNPDANRQVDETCQLPKLELELKTICYDFTRACLEKLPSTEIPTKQNSMLRSNFLDPLNFSKLPPSLDTVSLPEGPGISNGLLSPISIRNNPIVDLQPVLESFLPPSANPSGEDQPATDIDGENYIAQRLDHLLTEAMNFSIKYEHFNNKTTDGECASHSEEEQNQSGSIAVDCLIREWRLGQPTNEYRWTDLCSTTGDDTMGQPGYHLSPYSPASRLSSLDLSQDNARSAESIAINNRRNDMITPKSNQGQHVLNRNHLFNLPSSPDLGFPSSFDNMITSNSQPIPQAKFLDPPSQLNDAFSQLVPGPHADRNSAHNTSKKKRRVGGF